MRELEPSLGRFAFLTRWHSLHLPCGVCNGPFISPDSNHSLRNSTFSKQKISQFGTREGGRGGEGEGRAGQGRAGQGRAGEGRGGEGRGGEGRGGEGSVHTFHKPEPL